MNALCAGRLITTDAGERAREIQRLNEKYKDIIKEYAKFRAEYPYTIARAAKILERRRNREAKKAKKVVGIRNPNDALDDLLYPPGTSFPPPPLPPPPSSPTPPIPELMEPIVRPQRKKRTRKVPTPQQLADAGLRYKKKKK